MSERTTLRHYGISPSEHEALKAKLAIAEKALQRAVTYQRAVNLYGTPSAPWGDSDGPESWLTEAQEALAKIRGI